MSRQGTARSVPGLLRYGLHRELSSDTDDTDYEPGKDMRTQGINGYRKRTRKRNVVSSSSEDSDTEPSSESTATFSGSSSVENKPKKALTKKRKKKPQTRKSGRKILKYRKFGDPNVDDDSDDSDYVPDGKIVNVKTKTLNDISDEEDTRSNKLKPKDRKTVVKHKSKPRSDTWADLPVEILSKIFSLITDIDRGKGAQYVVRCSSVCKWWREVALQPISWSVADLAYLGGCEKANDKLLIRLCKNLFQKVKVINLSGWTRLTNNGLDGVIKWCPRLESVNLSHCQKQSVAKISSEIFLELAQNCTKLSSINLSHLRFPSNYSKNITKFIKICGPNLKYINFSENIQCGSWLLTCIMNFCPSLVSVDLSNTNIRSISFKTLQNACPKLRELYLTNLSLEPRIEDNQECAGFKYLEICSFGANHSWCNDSVFKTVFQFSTKLKLLDIRGHLRLTENAIEMIPSCNIERLYMARCEINQNMMRALCSKWNNSLKCLDLSWTEAFGVPFDVLIDDFVFGINPCKQIESIDLSGTSITDTGVKHLLVGCTNLESLDITSCRGVSRGIKRIHNSKEAIRKLKKFYNT